jgi:hypothetical protein
MQVAVDKHNEQVIEYLISRGGVLPPSTAWGNSKKGYDVIRDMAIRHGATNVPKFG